MIMKQDKTRRDNDADRDLRHQALGGVIAATCAVGLLDYFLGFEYSSFVFYFIPISIAGWRLGLFQALAFSLISAMVWLLVDYLNEHTYSNGIIPIWNACVRLVAFMFVGWSISSVARRLAKTDAEVKLLEGLLPICASCKKIRTDHGSWQQIEQYISEHSDASFTHGYCPDCGRKLLKDAGLSAELLDKPNEANDTKSTS